jgi:hypothetical protein
MEGIEVVALTDVAVRNAKPGPKPYKMGDSHGLFLLVQPTGGKLWRFKYRVDGREKKLAIGPYPEIGLGEARRRRDEAREAMAAGKDPAREKQRDKVRAKVEAENTFAAITAEFCEKRKRDGQRAWAPATAKRCEYLLSILCGSIGNMRSPKSNLPMCWSRFAGSKAKANSKALAERSNWRAPCSVTRSPLHASSLILRATSRGR